MTTDNENSTFNWNKMMNVIVIPLIILSIVGAISTIIIQGQRITTLEAVIVNQKDLASVVERVAKLESKNNLGDNNYDIKPGSVDSVENPQIKLIEVIKINESNYVKESSGTESYQCFTAVDYQNFMSSNIPNKIVNDLRNSNEFISLVLATKKLHPNDWQKLENTARNTYKRTWNEIGRITKEGQTDLGQKAEKSIATAIIDCVIELRRRPDAELRNMYR